MNWKVTLISFLEKFRRLTEDPLERLTEIGLKEGMTLLDLGCTLGFYSFPAASIVGEEGMVYALDVNPDFIEYVSRKAKKKGIENVRTMVAKAQNTGLPPESVDIVFLHLVFHDIEDKPEANREFDRILKADGKFVIDEENVMPVDTIRKLVEETGFRSFKTLRQTVQIFEKKDSNRIEGLPSKGTAYNSLLWILKDYK